MPVAKNAADALARRYLKNKKQPLRTAFIFFLYILFCQDFFLPAPLSAPRTLHVSCSADVHGEVGLPVGRHMPVMTFLTFIIACLLFDGDGKKRNSGL